MKINRNDVLEGFSCLLLIIMVALSFTYDKNNLLTALMIVLSISVFCVITYFSFDEKEKELGLIKFECMLFCLLLMIYVYYQINMMIPLFILLIVLFISASKEMKKR